MNAIEALKRDIERALPAVEIRLRRPRVEGGTWWLDAKVDQHAVTVQWSPRRGFGVSAAALTDGLGEGPDEVFDDRAQAATRAIALLRDRGRTVPPPEVLLRELRALVGVTQEQLADRLGVQQAAVSRLERRPDITLGSLRRYVSALGGELEIRVRTASGEPMRLFDSGDPGHGHAARESSTTMNLCVLRVRDLERSRSFYGLLGLAWTPEQHGAGPRHYSCRVGDTVIELYPRSRDASARSDVRLGFRLPVTSRAIDDLLAAGWITDRPRVARSHGKAHVYVVEDPDGNAVELEVPAA